LLGLDVAARAAAEGQIEAEARNEVRASRMDASIRSFPFVPRLAASGTVSEVRFHAQDLQAGELVFPRVDVELYRVRVSRRALRDDQRVELQSISHGRLSAELDAEALSELAGQPVRLPADGSVSARVDARGRLVLTVADRVALPPIRLPRSPLVPCASSVTVLSGRLRVRCDLREVPPALVRAVNSAG
jgi:hypothetical protein